LYYGFEQACAIAGLNVHVRPALLPHDLRHRFAITRLAMSHVASAENWLNGPAAASTRTAFSRNAVNAALTKSKI